jgi:hypothetical protein
MGPKFATMAEIESKAIYMKFWKKNINKTKNNKASDYNMKLSK